MSESRVACCWGGPLHGQLHAHNHYELRAARMPRSAMSLTLLEDPPAYATPYFIDIYHYESVEADGYTFGTWMIQDPKEQAELWRAHVVDGLNLVRALAKANSL